MSLHPIAVLVLLAALPLQDADQRVASLVARLDDDSVQVRERATAELVKAGKNAVPGLRHALEEGPSAETKARIEQVLRSLDGSRPKEGGATVAGLCATLRLKSADGTSLVLEAEITNVDDLARPFSPIFLWNKTLPHQRFISNVSEATIEMSQRSGERPKAIRRATY